MNKWRHQIQEFRQLGPRRLAFRVWFEVANRSGLRERMEPPGVSHRVLPEVPELEAWWASLGERHWFRQIRASVVSGEARGRLEAWLGDEGCAELLERAGSAVGGTIRCFSRWEADYADEDGEIDWHLNPRTGARWPLEHASKVLRHAKTCGDVKFTWEIGRFPHAYTLARAYVLTGDSKWVRAFCAQLESWEAENPYRLGVHWSSGQELAIRLMAWCFAIAVMGGDEAFGPADFERFARQAYLHAEHIEANIDYARLAVHNNHLIGEALGLYLVGRLFPSFDKADAWVKKGQKLLTEDCLDQFWADGGYCQSSHTYHRLALHYYLWAFRLGVFDGMRNIGEVRQTLGRSGFYLEQFLNEGDGRLPNWGANDGSLLNPWTVCDYMDFRPLLGALRYLDSGARSVEDGPWDEELFWFFGPGALNAPVLPIERKSTSFDVAGLHILRKNSGDFAVFRCGSVIDRFGQADQLHVDLWHHGENIAVDGGAYCYNDELAFHHWFKGTGSHNTVSVDGHDQMLLFRRFKWLYWTEAFSPGVKRDKVEGLQRGYEWLGVTHHRELSSVEYSADNAIWQVVDWFEKSDDEPRRFRLHWLLDVEIVNEQYDGSTKRWRIEFDFGGERGVLSIRPECTDGELAASAYMSRRLNGSGPRTHQRGEGGEQLGCYSRYYGERLPAQSIIYEIESARPIRFVSVFELSK